MAPSAAGVCHSRHGRSAAPAAQVAGAKPGLGDAAREARRIGLPFGNFLDPLGPGVARWMAIFPYAEREGRVVEYLRATFEGIWTRALDAASDDGLRAMVEQAGLDWREAKAHLG